MSEGSIIGVDLSKNVFQCCTMNHVGKVIKRQRVSRAEFLGVMGGVPKSSRVYMEACGSSHYWSRRLKDLGLNPYQIAPQFVKPYVKSQKNDNRDSEAICEAGSRGNMRFVPMKSEGQLELQAMHRIRERLIHNRTALINQLRGVLSEHGVVVNIGVASLKKRLLQADSFEEISITMRELILELSEEFKGIEEKIAQIDVRLKKRAKESPVVKRLCSIPGIGVLSALALVVVSGNPKEFKNGRQFSAFLGLVPRQVSTGGHDKLLGISKRGNVYVRTLLIHGARSVVRHSLKKTDSYSLWVQKLYAKYGTNHTAVAVANKNARIAWRVLTSNDEFDLQKLVKADVRSESEVAMR